MEPELHEYLVAIADAVHLADCSPTIEVHAI